MHTMRGATWCAPPACMVQAAYMPSTWRHADQVPKVVCRHGMVSEEQ